MIDDSFSRTYRCEALYETSNGNYSHYYYPGASLDGGHDGLLVRVFPEHHAPWLGTFQNLPMFGRFRDWREGSRILTTPDPDRSCVVAGGLGYFVSANCPTDWQPVNCAKISETRSLTAHRLIVFADYTDLVAYDGSSMKWRTERLARDQVKITRIKEQVIHGQGHDVSAAPVKFRVDIATGVHTGGMTLRSD